MPWQDIVAASLVTLIALAGVLITAVTLPGIWTALLLTLLVWWWRPELFEWWSIAIVGALAVLGEVAEFLASAAGAAKAKGSKAGAVGSIVGALVGGVAGTIVLPIPIIGTVVGAIVGAGAGAIIAERGHQGRPWKESLEVGRGAAVGRALAVVVKTVVAGAAAAVLIVAAWWP